MNSFVSRTPSSRFAFADLNMARNWTNRLKYVVLITLVLTFCCSSVVRLKLEGNKQGHYIVDVDITRGWKPLCGYSWGMNNAKVVCRQLGYPGVLQVSTLPRKRKVCNRAFNCSGNEDYISECPKMVTKNGSFHDAMVKCMPGESRFLSGQLTILKKTFPP